MLGEVPSQGAGEALGPTTPSPLPDGSESVKEGQIKGGYPNRWVAESLTPGPLSDGLNIMKKGVYQWRSRRRRGCRDPPPLLVPCLMGLKHE